MPKKVTGSEIARWRQMQAEGKSDRLIGEATGWQARTVKKHLEAELKSTGTRQIREELFKERIGRHWDMLLEGVLEPLSSLSPVEFGQAQGLTSWTGAEGPATGNVRRWATLEGRSEIYTAGAHVRLDDAGGMTVEAEARATEEWPLLMQHLPRDPLWAQVVRCEEGLRDELLKLRALYLGVEKHLTDITQLPIVERLGESPALSRVGVQTLFDRVCEAVWSPYKGVPVPWSAKNEFVEAEGVVMVSDTRAALASDGSSRVLQAVTATADVCTSSAEANAVIESYSALRTATEELKRAIAHLRLMPYLPGVCAVCGRVELY